MIAVAVLLGWGRGKEEEEETRYDKVVESWGMQTKSQRGLEL
jgi:hypothetical protein